MITNSPTAASSHASETTSGTSTAASIRRQIAGVSVADLAREHGTPLYVYDAEMIRRRCRDLAAWEAETWQRGHDCADRADAWIDWWRHRPPLKTAP